MRNALYCTILIQTVLASYAIAGYSWGKADDALSLLNDGKVVWRSNHAVGEGKPSIHPLALTDGTVLTAFRPADHPWHRGVWFAWKFINGNNYWEEGYDGQSTGRTEVHSVQVKTGLIRRTAEIIQDISYHLPGKPALIKERRVIRFSNPGKKGYFLDWESSFSVEDDLSLDRIAIPGEPGARWFGGYAGFSLRMARETIGWDYRNSSGLDGTDSHGQPARWMTYAGQAVNGSYASVVVFDHPSNPRHPSAWYVSEKMPYFSPGLLFNAPLILKKGEAFTLRYRVLINEGKFTDAELLNLWEKWKSDK